MSFSQNGSRRYGHVPPAQYGAPNPLPTYGLARRSSFDNGDDAAYIDHTARRNGMLPPPPHPSTSSRPSTAQSELFMPSSTPEQYVPGRSSYASNSPVVTSHQQQYASYDSQSQTSPPPTQSTYNPQDFRRTYSQSSYASNQQISPQHYQQTPASPTTYAHATYNPAAYQSHLSQTVHSSRVQSYGHSSSGSPAIPQSPTAWAQPQYTSHQVPARVTSQSFFDPSSHVSAYPASPPVPPPRPAAYSPVAHAMTPPMNGSMFANPSTSMAAESQTPYPVQNQIPVGAYGGYDSPVSPHRQKSASQASTHSGYAPPTPTVDSVAAINRHPTLRPLPKAPDEPEDDRWDRRSTEEYNQDKMYEELEQAIMGGNHEPPSSNGQAPHDLLDNELEELQRYNAGATNLHSSGARRSPAGQEYDDWDEESDLEAAAGLEAMRIAEEENTRFHRTSSASLNIYSPTAAQQVVAAAATTPERNEPDSSDDEYGVDIGLYGGGYAGHMSYGEDLLSTTPQPNGEPRPLPSPQMADGYAATTAHARRGSHVPPTDTNQLLQPFPEFQPTQTSPSIDAYGTGGLQRPASSQRQRLSFDDGDDQYNLEYRPGASGGESPYKDDIPEIFYHPGHTATQRPLPAVPPMSENRTPQLMEAGAYRSNSHHSSTGSTSTDSNRHYYSQNQDSYGQGMLSPGGSYVPRSSSLSSHPSTPQAVPPVRSKTDADERQARRQQMGNRTSVLENIDSATAQPAMGLDLPVIPVGRRKKFVAEKLSTTDFRKCTEPWALSGIASWLRELAGGDTGEGEVDLRSKTIVDGLVALFTHKVPTMNIADAETLAARAVDSLMDAGVLMQDEEWIKFGHGTVSGVIWQLTGSGCYAPKLHELEIQGRCYSHHCHRTLKKVNLQTHAISPAKKTEDWALFYKVTPEQLAAADKKEIQRQNNIHEIIQSEDLFMDQLDVVRIIYRDELRSWQPPIIAPTRLPKFLTQVFGKVEAIKQVNEDHLLAQLKYRQQEQGPWIQGVSDIFREWIRKARHAYVEYAAAFPYAAMMIRKESDRNILFRQFLNQAQNNKLSNRLDWNTYLKAPITRLQRYSLLLSVVHGNLKQENEEKANLLVAIEEIRAATFECDAKVDEMQKKVEMIELSHKLNLRPGMDRVQLNLDHLGRELLFRGDLQRAGASRFQWLETHALLFDHYLVLAKSVYERDATGAKRKEKYDVSKLPIPMQLLVLESSNDDAVVKSSLKGLPVSVTRTANASTSDTELIKLATNGPDRPGIEHTNTNMSTISTGSGGKVVASTNLEADAKAMYPFKIKHLGRSEIYTLYAPTARNRQEWCEKILEAKTRHAAALFEQNAEPFHLRIVADSAFAYDAMSVATRGSGSSMIVEGTPLDRAIRAMEKEYGPARPGPVCRALVNCATTFNAYGKEMSAIGTDFGVFVAEAGSPRSWSRSIQLPRVSQITVLEEFSVCLIISEKTLIAYHLDALLPIANYPAPHNDSLRRAPQKLSSSRDISFFATARMKERMLVFYKKKDGMHSTFKVLEPVLQKSTEKRSRLFSKKLIGGNGSTEFFREFDEFYIPTDCFGINLFHSYISVSTLRGFELLTLDKKITMSVPDLKEPSIASIAQRVGSQKPLGMFRLSESEFLLCYEESAVYIDKHGDVSRSVIMEFVGRAKTAAMYGAYLVLFDSDFVEIRNAENGRLRQIIAGRDVRCLDYGVHPAGSGHGAQRPLKFAMGHPEYPNTQIILELILNEGQKE